MLDGDDTDVDGSATEVIYDTNAKKKNSHVTSAETSSGIPGPSGTDSRTYSYFVIMTNASAKRIGEPVLYVHLIHI